MAGESKVSISQPPSPRRTRHPRPPRRSIHGASWPQNPYSLRSLPDEVVVKIFKRLPKRDLCSVSRLDRRFHGLADSVLYETIHFATPDLHLSFSQSLSRRPRRGSAIRELDLAYPASELSELIISGDAPVHGSYYDHAPVRYDSLSRTISTMSNLEKLDIAVPVTLLPGIGKLFDGPFDLACLTSCTLFYQTDNGGYWDLQENINIFSHPSLETLVIRHAKLDHRGFDCIEQPHETALNKLHLIECDFNDDALSDILMFPKALTEFVLTQTTDPSPELEESSDRFEEYIAALRSAAHSLETITIDFPSLGGHRALRMRDFEALKTLRMNWDYQLFGQSSAKPRMHSVGLPPELETLEFFNPMGTDGEVTDLLVFTLENLSINAGHMRKLIVVPDDDDKIPEEVKAACASQPQLQLDIIGCFDAEDASD